MFRLIARSSVPRRLAAAALTLVLATGGAGKSRPHGCSAAERGDALPAPGSDAGHREHNAGGSHARWPTPCDCIGAACSVLAAVPPPRAVPLLSWAAPITQSFTRASGVPAVRDLAHVLPFAIGPPATLLSIES